MPIDLSRMLPTACRRASQRVGRFRIATPLAVEFDTLAKLVMGQCIVLRAEHLLEADAIEYTAISEHFAPLPIGNVVPLYRWTWDEATGLRCE